MVCSATGHHQTGMRRSRLRTSDVGNRIPAWLFRVMLNSSVFVQWQIWKVDDFPAQPCREFERGVTPRHEICRVFGCRTDRLLDHSLFDKREMLRNKHRTARPNKKLAILP